MSWIDVNEHFILVATTQELLERRPVTQLYLISAILDTISLHLPHSPSLAVARIDYPIRPIDLIFPFTGFICCLS